MSNIWNAQILDGSLDGETIVASTSVYADTELEAKVAAAAQLGAPIEKVRVAQIPDVTNPSDEDLRALWAEAEANQTVNTETTGGSAYG